MSRWQRRFAVVILVELVLGLSVVAYFTTRPKIPAVDFSQIDVEAASEINAHQQGMTLSRGEHWQSLARLYLGFGYLPQAEICARQATELDPNSKDAVYLWAVTLDRLGRLDEAVEKLKQAQTLGLGAASASVRLARLELRREAADEAEQAFRTALEQQDDEASAAVSLGRLLLLTNRAAEVEAVVRPFIEKEPQSQAPCQLMAWAELEQGRPQAAEDWRLKAEWRPSSARFTDPLADTERWGAYFGALWWVTQGRAARAAGQDEAAAHMIQHALSLGWDEKFAIEAATLSLKLEQPRDALSMLRHVTSVAGRAPQTSFLRGEAYLIQRKTNSAIDDWSESVRLRENQAAERRLAQTYHQQPEVEKEHVARMLFAAGIDACEAGDPEETAAAMTDSLKLKPEQSMAWYFLGEARRVQGQDGPARDAYQRCLEINPDHGRAREALAALDAKTEAGAEREEAEPESQ